MSLPKRILAQAAIGLLISIIPLAVLGINVYAWWEWREIADLRENGIPMKARVMDKQSSGTAGKAICRVTVAYEDHATGNMLQQEVEVDEGMFSILWEEGTVSILVDADEPGRFIISGNEIYIRTLIQAAISDLLLLISLVVLYMKFGRKRPPLPAA